MNGQISIHELLDREFLPTRARILEVAASLDRVTRTAEGVPADPRWSQLRAALELVLEPCDNRAEQVQLLFSRPYEANWRNTLGLKQ